MNSFHIPCLSWCIAGLPWWVGVPGFGNACQTGVLPLGARSTSTWPIWERTLRGLTHNLPIIPTPASCRGISGVQMGIAKLSAAALPGNLHLTLTWVPGWPLHTCAGQACIAQIPPTRKHVPPAPSNLHTCWAHQPCVSAPAATMVPPPGI